MWKISINAAFITAILAYTLTHLPLDKMAAILADDIYKRSFLNESDKILI